MRISRCLTVVLGSVALAAAGIVTIAPVAQANVADCMATLKDYKISHAKSRASCAIGAKGTNAAGAACVKQVLPLLKAHVVGPPGALPVAQQACFGDAPA